MHSQSYILKRLSFAESNVHRNDQLTHLSLASLLWDIGKQHSPRWDAAESDVPSGAILFA